MNMDSVMNSGFRLMGGMMLFGLIPFVLVFGLIVFLIVRMIARERQNDRSPRLTVDAVIVAKRTNVSHHRHAGTDHHMGHTHTSTTYYVTFEVSSGDRMELHVAGHEYGLLVEGDRGKLTFQGTRYLGFQRT